MLLKFLNKTGNIISLENADTNRSKELINDFSSSMYEVSKMDDNGNPIRYYEFDCTSAYLVVKIAGGVSPNKTITSCIIPIPINGQKSMFMEFGLAGPVIDKKDKSKQVNTILIYDNDNPTQLVAGKIVETPITYEDSKILFVGLGKYKVGTLGGVTKVQNPVYMSVRSYITSDKENNEGVLYDVYNISVFMNSKKTVSTMDKFQIFVILVVIFVVCILIAIVVVTERRKVQKGLANGSITN